MANLLGIGLTGLNAAQLGMATTGHNIANAATPGYSRQLVIQTTPLAANFGNAYVGNGTAVAEIKRSYSDYLARQVTIGQTSEGQLSTYHTEMKQLSNMFADTNSGLSPMLQNFFSGLQNALADSSSGAARQSMLSSANTLASKFRSMDAQLAEIRQGVNEQVTSTIQTINAYATQLADLNQAITTAQLGSELKPANDLLDQRDHVLSELSKQVQVSVVRQGDSYNVYIGNGQPLVIENQSYTLAPIASSTDLNRIVVGYKPNATSTIELAESSITGGVIGGLFEFRATSLDPAQNAIGRIAIGLADTFNTQHLLGQDLYGNMGTPFFSAGSPVVTPSSRNTLPAGAVITSTIGTVANLTTSDYRINYDGTNYTVTQLSDNTILSSTTLAAAQAATAAKGFDFAVAGTPTAGDVFLIQPTLAGASAFNVAITDPSMIALAGPIRTILGATNIGSGTISPGAVDATFTTAGFAPVTLTVSSTLSVTANGANTGNMVINSSVGNALDITGSDYRIDYDGTSQTYSITRLSDNSLAYLPNGIFPPAMLIDGLAFTVPSGTIADGDSYLVTQPRDLTVSAGGLPLTVTLNGVAVAGSPFAANPIPYTEGAEYSFGGITFTLDGMPADTDTFTITRNTNGIGVGDNRNGLLLAALQSANTLAGNMTSYQGAYGQLVNAVGNKTRELEVTSKAASELVRSANASHQALSGVNLDEEAANLMRYQQAYQASGKVMQTAATMFDVLLSLGG